MNGSQNGSQTWPQECPFAEVGCSIVLYSSSEYQTHLSKYVEKHLQMVTEFHQDTIAGDSSRTEGPRLIPTSPLESESDTQTEGSAIISPTEKLKAVESEVEFLTDVLSGYGIGQLPALECIKTQLKMPEVGIATLGDSCTFRLENISQYRETPVPTQKWLSPNFFVRGGHKMRLVVYPNGVGAGEGTHLSLKLVLLFDDQLDWPISLPSHLGIRVELLIESEGLFDEDSAFDEDPMTATRAPVSNTTSHHPLEFTWKPRSDRRSNSSSTSPSPKSPSPRFNLAADKRYSFNRKVPATSLVRRASFNEKSSRGTGVTSEEKRKRLSRILPPWCQQPSKSPQSPIAEVQNTAATSTNGEGGRIAADKARKNDDTVLSKKVPKDTSRHESVNDASSGQKVETVKTEKFAKTREHKRDKKSGKEGGSSPSYEMSTGDGVDGATVFSMENFATHEQIDKYTQEYNSLVFHITLCLV
jgi:hypothetical protein